jgi:hypothetical protein
VTTCYVLMENMNLGPHLGFAIECFREATRLRPQWVAPYNNSAVALHFMGSGKEAVALLKQASKVMPDLTLQYNMSLIDQACSRNLEATNLKLISSGITCRISPLEAPRIESPESRTAL